MTELNGYVLHVKWDIRSNRSKVFSQPPWYRVQREEKTDYVNKSVAIVKLFVKLGILFCEHREGIDSGNYLSICDFVSEHDPYLKPMQSKYLNCKSCAFQNLIISLCKFVRT